MVMLSALLIIISVVPATADDQHFGFVVMGDSRGKSTAEQINASVLVSLRDQITNLRNSLAANKPEFLIFLGDMCMDGGEEQIKAWKVLMEPLPIPYFVTVGNHELYAKDGTNKRLAYQQDFATLLNNPPTPVFYTSREDHRPNLAFSFRKGNALFVILDAYYVDPQKDIMPPQIGYISKGQYNWMKDVLDRANKDNTIKHKFVFAHAPLDCSNADPRKKDSCDSSNYSQIKGDLKKYNVDAFFAGHDHVFAYHIYDYEDKNKMTKYGMLLTSGRAGAPKETVDRKYPSDEEVLLNHFLYVKVDDENWQISVFNINGGLSYQFNNGVKH